MPILTFLIILLVLVLIIVILLFCPIRIYFSYKGKVKITVRYLFLDIGSLVKKKFLDVAEDVVDDEDEIIDDGSDKEKQDKKDQTSEEKEEEIKEGIFKRITKYLEIFSEMLPIISKTSKYIISKIKIKNTGIFIRVSGKEPYDVGINYGRINTVVYSIYAAINKLTNIKNTNINIEADFDNNGWKFEAQSQINAIPIHIVYIGIVFLIHLLKLKLNKK